MQKVCYNKINKKFNVGQILCIGNASNGEIGGKQRILAEKEEKMKKFWSKLSVLLIAGAMLFSLAACGGKDDGYNEDGTITIESYSGENASTYMTTLTNRANRLPDLFYMPDYDFLQWAANGTLKDISSYVTESELSQLWPQAVDEYYFNPNTINTENQTARLCTACRKILVRSRLSIIKISSTNKLKHITWTAKRSMRSSVRPIR